MSFSAVIQDVFDMPDGRMALVMTEVEGLPLVGDSVRVGDAEGRVVALGANSVDGQVISTRACLTGKNAAPYGAIKVTWRVAPRAKLRMQRIEGTSDV